MRSSSPSVPHLVNGTLLGILIAGSLAVYPLLPEEIPRHFGLYGQADAYWSATLLHWMLLPLVAVLSAGLLYGSAWLVGTLPSASASMPNQKQYDALSAEKKRAVLGLAQQALYWMGTALLLVFLAVQAGIFLVATTPTTRLPAGVLATMGAGLLGVGGIVVWLVWGLPRQIRRLSD